MKKSALLVSAAVMIALASCGRNNPGKVVLKDSVDSVSYTIGFVRAQSIPNYLSMQEGIDSAYIKDFVKGFYKGAQMGNDDASKAYFLGLMVAQQELNQSMPEMSSDLFGDSSDLKINAELYKSGFVNGSLQNTDMMSFETAISLADSLYEAFFRSRVANQYVSNKIAGEEFLAAKAKEEGVVSTGSGLLYKIIKEGRGVSPTMSDVVNVKYEGSLVDGTLFEKNEDGVEIRVNGVIPGWAEALQMMKPGAVWELYIPYQLAYGDQENRQIVIKPYSALVFRVELVKVSK